MVVSAMRVQFLSLVIVCGAHAASYAGNYTDMLALLEFKKTIISDPKQALMSWNDSIHFCIWKGIMCSAKHPNRVTSLNLTKQGLIGPISPSLGNLSFLNFLILSANSLTGKIPPSLGYLNRLQTLDLTNNTLQGRIPTSLANCSRLKEIDLGNNILVGQIPSNFTNGLQSLSVYGNNLTGTIPTSLGNITTLQQFSCTENHIEGNIPNEFGNLQELRYLLVGSNKLSGHFPQAVLNLSKLVGLSFALSGLSGGIPSNLGNSLPNLEILLLDVNMFDGHIPSSLTNATSLRDIDLSRNNFTGVVPSSIGRLSRLTWLNLEINKLHARNRHDWEFMSSLANCSELRMISLGGNHLEGNVPSSVANLSSQLQYLYLSENQLTGDFPSGITNLKKLVLLAFYKNQFTGIVPEWIGTMRSLQSLGLGYNNFTGPIPLSVSNLSKLTGLYLESNQLDGQIPQVLGNLQRLEILNISINNLHGSVLVQIFMIPTILTVDSSFNSLDGPLDAGIGNAKQLAYLDLSSNNISGGIPASLGNVPSLTFLNLSHNNLSGSIPGSLCNLSLLDQLDLSFNQLAGGVPKEGIFKNATTVWIDRNKALCGGILELHLPACSATSSNSTKHKPSVIPRVVIPLASMALLTILLGVMLLRRVQQKRKSISSPSFGSNFQKVSYNDLARATQGFSASNLIGKGRFSSVYQGILFPDTSVVAIKVFNLEMRGAQMNFISECNVLRNIRHRNLVPVLTACSSIDSHGNDFKALVYKFMPRGDLHNLLYSISDHEDSPYLNYISLAQRLSIVVDISDALAYLHHNNQGTIVHCDLKPSNILLDDDMVAHVGDFGLSRSECDSTSSFPDSNSMSAIKGTIGYVAPECAGGGQISTASDVYSFGVVLLELFVRRRPTDDMFKDGMSITKYVEINFPASVLRIVDPQLLQELERDLRNETAVSMNNNGEHVLQSVLSIGLCCAKTSPSERISMQDVAAKLHSIRDTCLRGNR